MKKSLSNAVRIGSLSIFAYLASYVTRNILSVSTPEMIKESIFTKEYVGLLSSICFVFYAVGQLINGFAGDKIHPKYMIGTGFCISGLFTIMVPLAYNKAFHCLCFAMIGYSLSMLRGPITKVISESTDIRYARVICTLLNMAGFAGPVLASILSLFFNWRAVFEISGAVTLAIGIINYILISVFSARGQIQFKKDTSKGINKFFDVFKLDNLIFFMAMSAISEVANTSVTFWIPTYAVEHLNFSSTNSSVIFSIISVSTLLAPFIALLIYNYIIRDAIKISLFMYTISAVSFFLLSIISSPYVNIGVLLLARLAACCASGIVWSVYIPSLSKSSKVASANGVIDAAGYIMASVSNAVSSGFLGLLGWKGMTIVWSMIMLFGAIIAVIKNCKMTVTDI